jgi:deoxycytidylate deaminase
VTAESQPANLTGKPDEPSSDLPELFVLIVSALGTPVAQVQTDLEAAFRTVGYSPRAVRISSLLDATSPTERPSDKSQTGWLMDLGDQLRENSGTQGAAAMLAILKIRADRAEENPIANGVNIDRPGVVTIIRSAKRAEEVDFLRNVYGSRLLVIGVSQAEERRRETLSARIGRERTASGGISDGALADELLRRDEEDDSNRWGQSLQKAFGRADAFLWLRAGHEAREEVTRLVELWFQQSFTTPSRDEQGMFHASAAQYRSAAAGRQVGVAIIDQDGEVLVTGTNEVPRPGGGQFWPGDSPDYRDFKLSYETNDVVKRDVIQDVLRRLKATGWLAEEQAKFDVVALVDAAIKKDGPLDGARVTDLIEFGRIVHAEMAAICTAARRGTPLRGSTLYTTTYPCHECARLIIAAGVTRVVYIAPYTKSQVKLLFSDLVSHTPVGDERTVVEIVPFEGVAPEMFPVVFRMGSRRRLPDGTFAPWTPSPPTSREQANVPTLVDEAEAVADFAATSFGEAWLTQSG